MYQKPDFVKVSLKVSDIFANYGATGCAEREYGGWTDMYPCEGTDDYHYVTNTLSGMGLGYQCYLNDMA